MLRAFVLAAALLTLSGTAQAAVITFDTDPFLGSTALGLPGRQVVGGEPFIAFNIGSDVFAFEEAAFSPYSLGDQILFVNDVAANLPASGVNVVVLQSLDNDGNPATPFNAGTAANLIAAQITDPGAGFFMYFNQGLDLPRLVFSTDLSDPIADLKILARMTNLAGNPAALATFTAQNFVITQVPEPGSLALLTLAGAVGGGVRSVRRRRSADRSAAGE